MADPFGRIETPEEEAPDFLGTEVPVAFKGQPALPVSGGPAIGAPTAPITAGGFTPPGTAPPSTVTGQPTTPLGGGEAPGGAGGGASGINFIPFIEPAIKLGNIAQKLFPDTQTMTPGGSVGAIPTGVGDTTTNTAPDVLSGQYNPPEIGSELGGGPAPLPFTAPPDTLAAPDLGGGESPQGSFGGPGASDIANVISFTPSGDPIPDEVISMFGGDRAAIEAAIQQSQVSPEVIMQLADAGELSGLGIDSAAGLTASDMAGLSSGIGVAGLILTGLKMAGIAEGEAARVAGSLLSLASGGIALSNALPALTQLGVISGETAAAIAPAVTTGATTAMTTGAALSATVSGVTAVLAPLIAWGMHELEASMRPNTLAPTRRANEQLFTATTDQIGEFNALAERARAAGMNDPVTMNALMNAGQKAMLDFYNTHVGIGDDLGIPGIGRDASPSGQVGGFDAATQGEMMAPYRQAMMNLAALDQALGSKAQGSQDWYGIFGSQLNPWSLNEAQYGAGSASANPLGLNAAQYGQKFTQEQLRAAAGGADPLDFALQQFAQGSPDWQVNPWPGP